MKIILSLGCDFLALMRWIPRGIVGASRGTQRLECDAFAWLVVGAVVKVLKDLYSRVDWRRDRIVVVWPSS